ncbi:MAG: zinc-dependent metalloprotease, partial [Bacteroidota bacterium]
KNAFQIKLMPEDADPMDVRYNLIQWVHRSTRGWSYGMSVTDPRTGEIIKGHVSLGSLRVRQDFLIAVGLLSPYESDHVPDTMMEMALARIRQLSAHEIGHTLGLTHNYSASMDGRASVMDYPHPYITLKNGNLDFSEAYDTGIGEWDKVSITYGYQDFAEGVDEDKALDEILMAAIHDSGLSFISDQDARPSGSAHPRAHLWDNGSNAADELVRVLEVRKYALDKFSENNIKKGDPIALLEESLAPVYFFHRYQTEAAVKTIGGLYYTYAVRGDGQPPTNWVPAEEQKKALKAVLKTITPGTLALTEDLIETIPPRPLGYWRDRETIKTRTGLTFDPVAAAETSADMTLALLLRPERATRLVQHHALNESQPGLDFVLDELIDATWKSKPLTGYYGEIRHAVNAVTLKNMMYIVTDNRASEQARAITYSKIMELKSWAKKQMVITKNSNEKSALEFAIFQIEKFENTPADFKRVEPLSPPDGSPIGMDCEF